jgi:hypothetical protein
MLGIADLVERIDQSILVVWSEHNAQVNRSTGEKVALAFPFSGVVHHLIFILMPVWHDESGKGETGGGKECRKSIHGYEGPQDRQQGAK